MKLEALTFDKLELESNFWDRTELSSHFPAKKNSRHEDIGQCVVTAIGESRTSHHSHSGHTDTPLQEYYGHHSQQDKRSPEVVKTGELQRG